MKHSKYTQGAETDAPVRRDQEATQSIKVKVNSINPLKTKKY